MVSIRNGLITFWASRLVLWILSPVVNAKEMELALVWAVNSSHFLDESILWVECRPLVELVVAAHAQIWLVCHLHDLSEFKHRFHIDICSLSLSCKEFFDIETTSIILLLLLVLLVMFHLFDFTSNAAQSTAESVAEAAATVHSTCNSNKSCPDHDDWIIIKIWVACTIKHRIITSDITYFVVSLEHTHQWNSELKVFISPAGNTSVNRKSKLVEANETSNTIGHLRFANILTAHHTNDDNHVDKEAYKVHEIIYSNEIVALFKL